MSALLFVSLLVMSLLTGLALCWPLLRTRADISTSLLVGRKAQNIALYRERVQELQGQYEQGLLSEADRQSQQQELARMLLSDVVGSDDVLDESLDEGRDEQGDVAVGQAVANPRMRRYAGALLLTLLLMAAALALYGLRFYREPAASWLALEQKQLPLVAQALKTPQTMDALASTLDAAELMRLLARYAHQRGDDGGAWFALATHLMQQNAGEPALQATKRAWELQPDNLLHRLAYAQMRLYANEMRLDPLSLRLLQGVLKQVPEHQGALMLLGMASYRSGEYQQAMDAWQRLAATHPESPEIAATLTDALARTRQQAEIQRRSRVRVQVHVAPVVVATHPEAQLFIYAKPAAGGMPIVAVRLPLTETDQDVSLDDTMALTPGNTLTAQKGGVQIAAHVSVDGTAVARRGDWMAEPVRLSAGTIPLADTAGAVQLNVVTIHP